MKTVGRFDTCKVCRMPKHGLDKAAVKVNDYAEKREKGITGLLE
ncbi:hypothetical protein [Pedobacter sp. ASV28]|nr:hypothetical protein [Pedobacter sp. ASV28]